MKSMGSGVRQMEGSYATAEDEDVSDSLASGAAAGCAVFSHNVENRQRPFHRLIRSSSKRADIFTTERVMILKCTARVWLAGYEFAYCWSTD